MTCVHLAAFSNTEIPFLSPPLHPSLVLLYPPAHLRAPQSCSTHPKLVARLPTYARPASARPGRFQEHLPQVADVVPLSFPQGARRDPLGDTGMDRLHGIASEDGVLRKDRQDQAPKRWKSAGKGPFKDFWSLRSIFGGLEGTYMD